MIFGIPETSLLLYFLATLIGFVVGAGLKHSFKIALVLIVAVVASYVLFGSLLSSSGVLPGLSAIMSFINPAEWLSSLFNWANGSVIAVCFCAGAAAGLWKG